MDKEAHMPQTILNNDTIKKSKIYYYNPNEKHSVFDFCKTLSSLIQKKSSQKTEVVLLCIGSDRATGDSLGPIIGYKLSQFNYPNLTIYGTLSEPVHAKNLQKTVNKIKKNHKDSLVIAVDASLGTDKHLGFITLGEGALYPGIGVDKELPCVGDIFITGIVNISGLLNNMLLQTTRLNIVMQLADFICYGIKYSIIKHSV